MVIRTFGTDIPEVAKCLSKFARGASLQLRSWLWRRPLRAPDPKVLVPTQSCRILFNYVDMDLLGPSFSSVDGPLFSLEGGLRLVALFPKGPYAPHVNDSVSKASTWYGSLE